MDSLVLISWYLKTHSEHELFVAKLESDIGFEFNSVTVVRNGVSELDLDSQGRFKYILGSNSVYEFSGYLEGIKSVNVCGDGVTVVINDSYNKNWNMSWLSRKIVSFYINKSRNFYGFFFKDVLVWPTLFSTGKIKPNSRIYIVNNLEVEFFEGVLNDVCCLFFQNRNSLISECDEKDVSQWVNKNVERWGLDGLDARKFRISMEHKIGESLDKKFHSFPNNFVSAFFYSLFRKVLGEKR